MDHFRRLVLYALVSGLIYLLWLLFLPKNMLGNIFFILELLIYSLITLFAFNHWRRTYTLLGGAYSLRARIDVIIPTKGEPLHTLNNTVMAACAISCANKTIYVIDDSNREEVKDLTLKYGAQYLVRPDRMTRAFKAATLNYALKNSTGNFILVLDADQIVHPKIIDDLLGYFKDEAIALVATKQAFAVPDNDFNHDHVFYNYMQVGKNADNTGISCGSGVIYRRSALQSIGGFQEWNIVEDLYTTYVLNTVGYKTLYVAQSYSKGDAPLNLKIIYKQRGTWALDSLRLLFWKLPFAARTKIQFRQFLHYFEMGYIYITSGLVIPLIYCLNVYSLSTNVPILQVSFWYLVFKLPSFYFSLKLYDELGQGRSSSRMWAALFPVYFWAILRALMYWKPQRYIVTIKESVPEISLALIVPQIIFIAAGLLAILFNLTNYGINSLLIINMFWLIVMVYWLYPVFPRALGINYAQKSNAQNSYRGG